MICHNDGMTELIKDISSIKFADYNPRVMKQDQDEVLGNAMDEFGDLGGITNNMPAPGINNLQESRLVTGHQRIRKLREKYGDNVKVYVDQHFAPDEYGTVAVGFVGVPGTTIRWNYREVQWSEAKEMAANVAANNIGAENDDEKLAKLDYELSQMEGGADLLALTGQSEKQIKKLMESVGVVQDDPNAQPEPPADESEKPEKLEFALTRDQRLVIERAIEHVKSHRELQAISSPSMNGSALYVMAADYLAANDNDQQLAAESAAVPRTTPPQPGELTDLPAAA